MSLSCSVGKMKQINNNLIQLEINKCLCGNNLFKFYDGCLGYESFICTKCGKDINDLMVE